MKDKCIILGCKNKAAKHSQRLCKKHFKEFIEDTSPIDFKKKVYKA